MAFDLFPLDSLSDNKIPWLGEAARGDWICGFGHDAQVDFARITAGKNKVEIAQIRI